MKVNIILSDNSKIIITLSEDQKLITDFIETHSISITKKNVILLFISHTVNIALMIY